MCDIFFFSLTLKHDSMHGAQIRDVTFSDLFFSLSVILGETSSPPQPPDLSQQTSYVA